MKSVTRTFAAATLAVPLALAVAAPSQAADRWIARSSGNYAYTSWMEVGALPGIAGNYHVGSLDARGDRTVYVEGFVVDWTCPDGELPPDGGGGHGEEPPETNCVVESERSIYGDPSQVTLFVDRRLAKATLVGTLQVSDHGSGTAAAPPVNITWTGIGTSTKNVWYESYTDSTGARTVMRTTDTWREGDVSGAIGAMIFDDEPGETSYGAYGTYKSEYRGSQP